jgi:protein TonB
MSRSRKTVSNYLAAFFAAAVLHAGLAAALGGFLSSAEDRDPETDQTVQQDTLVVTFYQPPPAKLRSEATEPIIRLREPLPAPDPEPAPIEPVVETPADRPQVASEKVETSEPPVPRQVEETAFQSPVAPHPPQPKKYTISSVKTEKPRPLRPIDAEVVYPLGARLRGEEGAVRLLVIIDVEGSIDELKISESSGFTALDRAAERAVRRTRFAPATRRSQPVAGELTVTIRFSLDS